MKYLIFAFTLLFSINSFADYKIIYLNKNISIPESAVEPVDYPSGFNIMKEDFFSTFDNKQSPVSQDNNIKKSVAYLTDYDTNLGKDYDHFLTGEFWGMPRNNSVVFRLTQSEEVSRFGAQFANTSLMPSSMVLYGWSGTEWLAVGGAINIDYTQITVLPSANEYEIFKIKFENGDSSYAIDPNRFFVELI